MKLKFKKLHENAVLPKHAKDGDAGMDLTMVDFEFYNSGDEYIIKHVHRYGLSVEIPAGYVGLLFPRSSICKTELTLTNCVGVIDSGYRGEIKAVFRSYGLTSNPWYLLGDRTAQLVVVPYASCETEWAEELTETERGTGGYGSSGK